MIYQILPAPWNPELFHWGKSCLIDTEYTKYEQFYLTVADGFSRRSNNTYILYMIHDKMFELLFSRHGTIQQIQASKA